MTEAVQQAKEYINVGRHWLKQIEKEYLQDPPLTPAHNQVLILTRTLFDREHADMLIAANLAAAVRRNTGFGEDVQAELYVPYVQMLKAEAYYYLVTEFRHAIEDYININIHNKLSIRELLAAVIRKADEGIGVAHGFIESEGLENRTKLEGCLSDQSSGVLIDEYVKLITELVDVGRAQSHFDDIDSVPLTIAAETAGLSKSRISRLISEGKLPGSKPGGYLRFVSYSAVKHYLDERQRGATGVKAPPAIIYGDKEYHLLHTASERSGFSDKWIIQLIRTGKVDGVQPEEYRGRWYVNLKSLNAYAQERSVSLNHNR